MDVKINMLGENIQSFIDLNGVKKINLQMLIGAILAGAYIGFGSVMMVIANQVLANPIMNGFVFSLGLILVVFACGELATGSMMSYAFKNVNVKWTTALPRYLLIILFITFGNLIGGMAWSVLAYYSGILNSSMASLDKIVIAKNNLDLLQLFLRGIICNIFVCLAIWTQTRTNSPIAKIILIIFCVMGFVMIGSSHSIADVTFLTLGMLHGSANFVDFLRDFSFVFIGNWLGGLILVLAFTALNCRKA